MSKIITCNFDPVALVPILKQWQVEANGDTFGLELDVHKCISDLRNMVAGEDADILLLIIQEKIIGLIGLIVFTSPLSEQRICNEHYMYILPKYRKGKNPIKLIRAAEEWAKAHDCTHIMFNASNLASELHDKVCRLYERLHMKKFETTYISEVA